MFTINEDKISDEFYSSSVVRQLDNVANIDAKVADALQKAAGQNDDDVMNDDDVIPVALSDAECNFLRRFSECAVASKNLLKDIGTNNLIGYMKTREYLANTGLTPEQIDYAAFIASAADDELHPSLRDVDAGLIDTYGTMPAITKIISNDPCTIVFFADGTKTIVRVSDNETFDADKGIYIALLKKVMGSQNLQHLFSLMMDAQGTTKESSDTVSA